MDRYVLISSQKFPILPGERGELVNEGTYGKALAQYLQAKLKEHAYDVPFVCCEDWGWWVEVRAPFTCGVLVHSEPQGAGPVRFVCAFDPLRGRKWSWSKFRFVDASAWMGKVYEDVVEVFRADKDVQIVGVYDEFPL